MGYEVELDLDGIDDKEVDSGGLVPLGYHHCTVDDVSELDDSPGSFRFKYKVVHGPAAGRMVQDTLWNPANSATSEKARNTTKRWAIFAKRLRLQKDLTSGKLNLNMLEAVGRDCVIQVIHKTETDGRVFANIPFAGIFPLGHDDIPEKQRCKCKGEDTGMAFVAAPVATTLAKEEFSDI